MTTDDLTKGSTDGKTAAATELESELAIIFPKSSVCAIVGVFLGLISSGIMMALSFRLLGELTCLCVLVNYWGMFATLYFSVHLDLEESYKIRRWCRKKLVQFSVILPGLDRSRINKVVFLLEQEEELRYLSRRTTTDAALTELEWELKIIFEENSFYASVHAGLCITFLVITALVGGGVLSERSSISVQMWFMSWFWILFWASAVNYNLRGPLDLDERDKWLREKIVACSVILPYQDRSRINKALLLMEKKEEEERQKVEQEQ